MNIYNFFNHLQYLAWKFFVFMLSYYSNKELKGVDALKKFLRAIKLDCLIYSITTIILNLIAVFIASSTVNLLKIEASLIVLAICSLISFLIVYLNKKEVKEPTKTLSIINLSSIFYTIFSIVVNIFAYIFKIDNFWDIYSILIILVFSIILSIFVSFVRIKSYLLSTIVYFLVIGVFYCIIFIAKTGFKGSNILIVLGIYIAMFVLASVLYYFIFKAKEKQKDEEKSYDNMFK